MLVVAIPKSASTSLMATLGELHGFKAAQLIFPEKPVPGTLRLLPGYHSDIRDIDDELAQTFAARGTVYKQHLPPSDNNLQRLRDLPVVVLLREPEEIVAAYCRADAKRLQDPVAEFAHCDGEAQWLAEARKNGLLDELEWFHERWLQEARAHPDRCLVVRYRDLVDSPEAVVNRVEAFWGLEPSAGVVLAQKRFSGASGATLRRQQLKMAVYSWLRRFPRLRAAILRLRHRGRR